ncbi:MAG: ADP-ribosylglycohydrolase family protein [Chloroflexi bacterium]|nr:ADP-ribosylglycohydrolase family protein [Chloroflexota bacterium]
MLEQNETGLIPPTPVSPTLADRFAGCLIGGAIGDGLGTATEGRTPEAIRERFGGRVEDFMPPFASKPDGRHKGDGHVSDDTLMVLALCRAYLAKGGQLDAHDMVTYFLPEIVDKSIWIPEYQREMPLIERLFYPEKYLLIRLRLASVNPREAGIGNMVNCGAAMYAAPVGLMNAGNADLAYLRAVNIFSAHQYSYGLEAAALMAACIAEALHPYASVESVVATALRLAKDGTKAALEAVIAATRSAPSDEAALQAHLRAAIEPYDTVKGGVQEFERAGAYPSQFHSIEELPLALAYLLIGQGDYTRTVLGAVNYGRDADSIAEMSGAIIGALGGKSGLPSRWASEIGTRNKIDFDAAAHDLYTLFQRDYAASYREEQARHADLVRLMSGAQS